MISYLDVKRLSVGCWRAFKVQIIKYTEWWSPDSECGKWGFLVHAIKWVDIIKVSSASAAL